MGCHKVAAHVDNDGRALARSLSRLCQRRNMQDRVEISIILSFYL